MEIQKINKRLVLIIAIVIVLALTILIFFLLNKKVEDIGSSMVNQENQEATINTITDPLEITKKNNEIANIINEEIDFSALSPDNKFIYFRLGSDRKFYKLNLQNNQRTAISEAVNFVSNTIWSPNRTRAVFEVKQDKHFMREYKSVFLDESLEDGYITLWFYNFETKNYKKLNDNIRDIRWIDDKKIVYYYQDDTSKNISITDPETTKWDLIKDSKTFSEGTSIETDGANIYYYPAPTEIGGKPLSKINIATKKDGVIIDKSEMSGIVISPSKAKIVYGFWHDNTQNTTIGILNPKNNSRKDTGVIINSDLKNIVFSKDESYIIFPTTEGEQTILNKLTFGKEHPETVNIIPSKDVSLVGLLDDKILYFVADYFLYKVEI